MRNSTILQRRSSVGRIFVWLFSISFSALLVMGSSATDWPNWRGPRANGSIETGNFPTQWDAANVRWKAPLPGKGTSTPIVVKDRIYVTSPADREDAVLAFDLNGKLLWQTKLGPESPPKHKNLASSCNASPVSDGNAIFVYFRSGNFAALELDGKVRWQINLVERFGRDDLFWDQGTSPVVTDKHVVMTRMHGGDSWIAGFDKVTGELKWRQPRNFKVPAENDNGYTTPVIFQHQDKTALLVWGSDHLTAHDAADGKVLWSCGGFNPNRNAYWPPIATPAIVGDIVVVPVGRDDKRQGEIHAVRLGGSGDVTSTHRVWQRDDFGIFVPTPAEYKGRVYLLRNRGEVVCLDPATGKTIWSAALPQSARPYYASPVIANGIMYAAREDGTVFVARVGDKFELLSEIPMGEQIIATPVLAHNRILLRSSQHLFCIGGD
jgi:outer membrane protein assembly factor BamB